MASLISGGNTASLAWSQKKLTRGWYRYRVKGQRNSDNRAGDAIRSSSNGLLLNDPRFDITSRSKLVRKCFSSSSTLLKTAVASTGFTLFGGDKGRLVGEFPVNTPRK